VLHLQANDRIALTVAGMSACLGAVVRAPITSILIVFEMTHQFSFDCKISYRMQLPFSWGELSEGLKTKRMTKQWTT